ncbi:MAG: sugar ABC transporter substrate-binding protein, partial [Actinomycetota bacterium]
MNRTLMRLLAALAAMAMLAAACGDDGDDSDAGGGDGEAASGDVTVSLITKDSTNPFFVAMQEGAREKADELGIEVVVGSGQAEGDDQVDLTLI